MIPDWARAHGDPVCDAAIRSRPEDFFVEERLDFEPDGDGEHDFLWIEKTGANTAWVSRQLARHAGVPVRDVGYAGLKDRHAVTRQAFTVRRPGAAGTDWSGLRADGVDVLDIGRHRRKLKRGAHRGNRFRIVLRGDDLSSCQAQLEKRLRLVAGRGVPNYFGEQRFGRDGGNVERAHALFGGRRMKRDQRAIALSAARSFVFNHILDARVKSGSWDKILPGERVNLDGSGSVFVADDISEDIVARCSALDLHPTATLWGRGAPLGGTEVAGIEQAIANKHEVLARGLHDAGVDASSRPLRLPVRDLAMVSGTGRLTISFRLDRGAFATAVLRELVKYD